MQTLAANQQSIKAEIFVFVTEEQLAKLTNNVNNKPQMLPVTSRNIGISTASLLHTQYTLLSSIQQNG